MKKRLLAVLLCVAMLAGYLIGCAKNDPKPEETEASTGADSTTNAVEEIPELPLKEPVTIKVMASADVGVNTDYASMKFWKMVEEKTNVHVEWEVINAADMGQKINLMYASGEYPDVIIGGTSVDDEEKYGVQQGVLVALDDYLTEEYMPNFMGLLNTRPDYIKRLKATDGHFYSIPKAWEIGYDTDGHIFLNQKWMDALNLETPKTLEELEDVLRAFKTGDPNGNGTPDEIPMEMTYREGPSGLQNLVGLFGQLDTSDHLILENDKVIFSAATDAYRKAMEWTSRMYKEGLIDPEAFSQDRTVFNAKLKSANVGCFMDWRTLGMGFSYPGMEDDYVCLPPLPINDSVKPVWNHTINGLIPGGAAITCTNAHVAETIKWLDFLLDPVIAMQARQGILGEFQEINEDGKFVNKNKADGTPYTNEELNMDAPGPGALFFLTSDVIKDIYDLQPVHLQKYPFCDMYRPFLAEQPAALINSGRLNEEDRSEKARLQTDIQKYVEETAMQFISNGVTDASWTAYIETLNQIGVDRYVELAQKGFDMYNAG